MTILEILKAARARIATPDRWTKKAYARDASGGALTPRNANAVCWCTLGAIFAESNDAAVRSGAINCLATVFGEDLVPFNDSHTHAEVIAGFDEAIRREEAA